MPLVFFSWFNNCYTEQAVSTQSKSMFVQITKACLVCVYSKSMFGLCVQQKHVSANKKSVFSDAVKQVASSGYLRFLKQL